MVLAASFLLGGWPTTGLGADEIVSDGPASTTVEVGDCGFPAPYECARVRVPLDHAQPDGPTVELLLNRHPATGDRIGTLIADVESVRLLGELSLRSLVAVPELAARFDLVEVWPRGFGFFECLPSVEVPAAHEEGDLEQVRVLAASCAATYDHEFLRSLTLENEARDIEFVRQLLGQDSISFLGQGRGASVGAVYASLFPDSVRAMVLDSPTVVADGFTTAETLSAAREAGLQRLARSCDAWPECAVADVGLVTAVERIHDAVDDGEVASLDLELVDALFPALYRQPWRLREIAPSLAAALVGDGLDLSLWTGDFVDFTAGSGLHEARVCAEGGPLVGTSADVDDEAVRTAGLAPTAGAVTSVPCDLWPISGNGTPPLSYTGSAPIIVVGNRYDAIAPYAGSEALATALGSRASLLTMDWSGHALAFERADRCLDEQLLSLLIDGTTPAAGAVCPQRGSYGIGMGNTIEPNSIDEIEPGSAADHAGLRIGDLVLEANGRAVANGEDLPQGPIGELVDLTIRRGEEVFDVVLELQTPVWELWRTVD